MDRRHIGAAFKSIAHRIDRIMNNIPAIRDNGKLTSIQVWILHFLFRNEGNDVFQRDVEREFHVRRSTATEILTVMEKNDLIRRERTDYDARLKKIALTDYAVEIRTQLQTQMRRLEAALTDGFTADEIGQFFSFAERFEKNLEKCE